MAAPVEPLEIAEVKYILMVLKECKGNIKKAAELLNISRVTVYRAIKKSESMQEEVPYDRTIK